MASMLPDASMNSSKLTADLADYKTGIHNLCTSKERHDQIALCKRRLLQQAMGDDS